MNSTGYSERIVERRAHSRYIVPEGAFAVLRPWVPSFGQDIDIIGQIIDVSPGGLALSYIADEAPSDRSVTLDILMSHNRFSLIHVPFRNISDFQTPQEFPCSSITTRRRGVAFQSLTEGQRALLQSFVMKYGTLMVPHQHLGRKGRFPATLIPLSETHMGS
jgi:hypothetical protein